MKGHYKIKVDITKEVYQGVLYDKQFNKFPYIYLSEDLSCYHCKLGWKLDLDFNEQNLSYVQNFRGFHTYSLKNGVITKAKVTKLSKLIIGDHSLTKDGEYFIITRGELRLI